MTPVFPAVRSFLRKPANLAASALGLALLWVYWPTLVSVVRHWATDPRYSHGYVVPLFAAYLLWSRRQLLATGRIHGQRWGLAILSAGLAVHFAGTYLFFDWLNEIAILPCLAGAAVLLGGWRALGWSWPAIAFLFFMLPLPYRLEVALSGPLQRMGTVASTYILQTLGYVAFSEGNVIRLDELRINVIEACSGLSMLLIFFALSTALVILIQRSRLEKAIIILSAIPIALIANITRITVTGMLHKMFGHELADLVFHRLAGWLMMIEALALLWVELRLLSWVLLKVPRRSRRQRPEQAATPLLTRFGWTLRALVRQFLPRRRRRHRRHRRGSTTAPATAAAPVSKSET